MKRHVGDSVLWIICADDSAYDVLVGLDLHGVRLLKLSELETEELLNVKSTRTIREYYWTLTPFSPRFVFEADSLVKRVTYVDADLWFCKNPKPIFDEFEASGKKVLITDHAYAPEYDKSATSGQYCVQFIIFERDNGEEVRKWWEERCVEWCFAREENGKFGDQKYLEEWPIIFDPLVHVLQNKEQAMAPWNAIRFPYSDAIFYHFQGLRIITENAIEVGSYPLPRPLVNNIYKPYFADLRKALVLLDTFGFELVPQAKRVSYIRRIYHVLQRVFVAARPYSQMKW